MIEYLSAQTFGEIVKILKGAIDDKKDARLLEARAELLGKIIDVQANYMALRQEYEDLLREKRENDEWEEERKHYQLKEIRAGAFVYARKPETDEGGNEYYACPNCFDQKEKSVLQAARGDQRTKHLVCHRCGLDINLTH